MTTLAAIAPVPSGIPRPWLSVVIPTWCPDLGYLEQAVRSVLTQLPLDGTIQLTIVDDASPGFDAEGFVQRFPSATIGVIRSPQHRGIAENWNACLRAAQGEWVHLLHQDDFVLPGFYAALRAGIVGEPAVGAAFSASLLCDASGRGWAPRLVPMRAPGVLRDWRRHVFARLSIQCSAIVVRRTVYETLGGFDTTYRYALDWDMWRRIAVRHPLWFHPEPLAAYRMHPGSESARQQRSGEHLVEIFRSIEQSAGMLSPVDAPRVLHEARLNYARFAVESALAVWRTTGRFADARRHLAIARAATGAPMLLAAVATVGARSLIRPRRLAGR